MEIWVKAGSRYESPIEESQLETLINVFWFSDWVWDRQYFLKKRLKSPSDVPTQRNNPTNKNRTYQIIQHLLAMSKNIKCIAVWDSN
jgi:hypothetical protein